ncbi:MAG: type II secretion system protein GspC [Candidatus Binataceae bacterium]|jgi:general secretion pathway protein C
MRFWLSERYIAALNFVLIAAIAYFAALSADDLIARTLNASSSITPPSQAARRETAANLSRASYSVIVDRDVFNSVKAAAPAPVAPVAADLHIKLLGTSELTLAKPFAIIEDERNHQQSLYRLGDEIPDAGTLVAVERKRVLINHDGELRALEIADDGTQVASRSDSEGPRPEPGIHASSPNHYAVDRATVDHNLQNMGSLLTQMRALPNVENGKTNGFRLSEIQQGSLFQQMGLQDGDIVKSVAGQTINDPMRAMELLSVLQNQQSISLQVIRNGQPVQINYDIR